MRRLQKYGKDLLARPRRKGFTAPYFMSLKEKKFTILIAGIEMQLILVGRLFVSF